MAQTDMPDMELMAYEAVREIQEMKKDGGLHPDLATKTEIFNSIQVEVMEALRSLFRKGMITFHRNVNGLEMFGIRENGNGIQ